MNNRIAHIDDVIGLQPKLKPAYGNKTVKVWVVDVDRNVLGSGQGMIRFIDGNIYAPAEDIEVPVTRSGTMHGAIWSFSNHKIYIAKHTELRVREVMENETVKIRLCKSDSDPLISHIYPERNSFF